MSPEPEAVLEQSLSKVNIIMRGLYNFSECMRSDNDNRCWRCLGFSPLHMKFDPWSNGITPRAQPAISTLPAARLVLQPNLLSDASRLPGTGYTLPF